ncbi:hypothetical protein Vafri_19693, partial [Volvox africanus]
HCFFLVLTDNCCKQICEAAQAFPAARKRVFGFLVFRLYKSAPTKLPPSRSIRTTTYKKRSGACMVACNHAMGAVNGGVMPPTSTRYGGREAATEFPYPAPPLGPAAIVAAAAAAGPALTSGGLDAPPPSTPCALWFPASRESNVPSPSDVAAAKPASLNGPAAALTTASLHAGPSPRNPHATFSPAISPPSPTASTRCSPSLCSTECSNPGPDAAALAPRAALPPLPPPAPPDSVGVVTVAPCPGMCLCAALALPRAASVISIGRWAAATQPPSASPIGPKPPPLPRSELIASALTSASSCLSLWSRSLSWPSLPTSCTAPLASSVAPEDDGAIASTCGPGHL